MVDAHGSVDGQETRFFRHSASFELLKAHLDQCLEQRAGDRPLTLWSVGCASGEETYSLAMTAAEAQAHSSVKVGFGVTGTDISLSALAKCRAAVYGARRLEQVEPALRERYFLSLPDDRFQVVLISLHAFALQGSMCWSWQIRRSPAWTSFFARTC